jgi:dipeptidase E
VAALLEGKMTPGYACDDKAGVLFLNEKYSRSVSLDNSSHTYFLSVKDGKISEELLESQLIQ